MRVILIRIFFCLAQVKYLDIAIDSPHAANSLALFLGYEAIPLEVQHMHNQTDTNDYETAPAKKAKPTLTPTTIPSGPTVYPSMSPMSYRTPAQGGRTMAPMPPFNYVLPQSDTREKEERSEKLSGTKDSSKKNKNAGKKSNEKERDQVHEVEEEKKETSDDDEEKDKTTVSEDDGVKNSKKKKPCAWPCQTNENGNAASDAQTESVVDPKAGATAAADPKGDKNSGKGEVSLSAGPVDNLIIVVGVPKSGTGALHMAFTEMEIKSANWEVSRPPGHTTFDRSCGTQLKCYSELKLIADVYFNILYFCARQVVVTNYTAARRDYSRLSVTIHD